MDLFTIDLRKTLSKAFGKKERYEINPLVVIGLTESILDLGLTEDQMYATIRSYCRQLTAQVHPDKTGSVSERQKSITEAFNLIDDRETFIIALREFRTLKAEERKESNLLRNSLNLLRQKNNALESNVEVLRLQQEELSRQKLDFERLRKEEPLLLPEIKALNYKQEQEIRILKDSIKKMEDSNKGNKRDMESLMTYVASLDRNFKEGEGIFVFSAKWVVVVSLSWNGLHSQLEPVDNNGKAKDDFTKAMFLVGAKNEDIDNTLKAWVLAKESYGKINPEDQKLALGISVISLKSGRTKLYYGIREGVFGGRVIGSMFGGWDYKNRNFLRHSINYRTVIEHMYPVLAPGALMVSISVNQRLFASWSNKCPSFKFNSKRLILSVG